MGYLQDYNAKQQTASTGSTGVGFLQQYNSRQKTTTKPTATPTVKPKKISKKKKVKDLTVSLVKPKSKFEKVIDIAKERAQNLVNNLTKKPLSPVVETKPKALPKTVQIKPGQKKLQKTQLKELFPDQPTAQASADFKTKLKPKIAKTSFNEMAGNVLSKVYKPVQYQLEEDLQGKKRKLTGGQILGGAIEDAMNSMIPSLGTGAITTAKGTISLGRQLLQGVKTGTVLSALHAVIKTLKEEEITAKDMLTAFGIGTLIGVWEPAPMTVAKGELQMAKNTLREYGINNYKNAVELKAKANKIFMKLHPDKGGDTAKFIEFNEAFNKVTSAGIDSSWKLPDISAWLKSLWRNSNKSEKQKALLKTKADSQFVKAVKEVVKSKPEVKISVGEKTPQQAIGEVIKSGKQNTPEGKEIIKMASEAQKTGQNIMVEKPKVAQAPIKGEVDPLIQEARKYKSAEEWIANADSIPLEAGSNPKAWWKSVTQNINTETQKIKPSNFLNEEAKNYKSANEFIKNVMNNSNIGLQGKIVEIPINKISGTDYLELDDALRTNKQLTIDQAEEIISATDDYKVGQQVKYPIEVIKNKDGTYNLVAGNHRLAQKLINGEKTIQANIGNIEGASVKSQLTDIWNKAQAPKKEGKITPPPAKTKVGKSRGEVVKPKEKPVIKPKTVSVPREQLPVGEGKEKVSRLEARVKQTLDNLTPGQVEQLGLSKYKQLNNKETIRKASEFVSQNPDKALQVLMGKENPPEGLPIDAIFVAMANNSTDNMELAIKLASLRATRYGQEIQILKELIPNSNVKLLSDIAKMKEQGVAERFNIKGISEVIRKRTEAVVNRTRRTLRKKLARTNWDAFINSIETC